MTAAILIKKKGILRPRARDEKEEVLRRLLGILKTHNNETIAGGGAG
ncbi:MAG: hypothetical protein QW692_05610 [Nitrososphaerota archaeon]